MKILLGLFLVAAVVILLLLLYQSQKLLRDVQRRNKEQQLANENQNAEPQLKLKNVQRKTKK